MYEFATEETQRYKEGRVILERALINEVDGFWTERFFSRKFLLYITILIFDGRSLNKRKRNESIVSDTIDLGEKTICDGRDQRKVTRENRR